MLTIGLPAADSDRLPGWQSLRRWFDGIPGDRLAGVVVAVLVSLLGAVLLLARPASYTAAASLVVLPAPGPADDQVASYYDTLSQGQITATFAEVLRASVTGGPTDAPTVTVLVVPGTSVIRLVATGSSAKAAERAADRALDASADPLARLSSPYRASVVNRAAGAAERVGRSLSLLVGALVIAALAAGLVGQRAWRELDRVRDEAGGYRPEPDDRPGLRR